MKKVIYFGGIETAIFVGLVIGGFLTGNWLLFGLLLTVPFLLAVCHLLWIAYSVTWEELEASKITNHELLFELEDTTHELDMRAYEKQVLLAKSMDMADELQEAKERNPLEEEVIARVNRRIDSLNELNGKVELRIKELEDFEKSAIVLNAAVILLDIPNVPADKTLEILTKVGGLLELAGWNETTAPVHQAHLLIKSASRDGLGKIPADARKFLEKFFGEVFSSISVLAELNIFPLATTAKEHEEALN